MKPSSRPSRTPSRLFDSLHRQLDLYALAASAAGVSLLALAQPSEAKIVYTKTHRVIGTNGIYPLDLNHDGTIDFLILELGSSRFITSGYNGLWVKEAFGNAVDGSRSQQHGQLLAAALRKRALVGPRQSFVSSTGSSGEVMILFGCSVEQGCSSQGQWANVNNRYLGLRFQIKGKTRYGWARLSVQVANQKTTARLTGYAYETIPRKSIRAGQTQGASESSITNSNVTETHISANVVDPVSQATQPASLGHLALGVRAIRLRRKP